LEKKENNLAFKVLANPRVNKGFISALNHSTLAVLLSLHIRIGNEWLKQVECALSALLPENPDENVDMYSLKGRTCQAVADTFLLHWMRKLQQAAKVPVFE
jgi:hypothetical protein